MDPGDGAVAGAIVAAGVLGGLIGLLTSLLHLVGGAAALRLASDAILGRPTDVGASYGAAFGRLLSLLWATLLAGLACTLLAITCVGLPFAIYLGIGWSTSLAVVMVERLGGRESLRRSSTLVGGHRWRVFGTLFLMGLLVAIVVAVPAGIVTFVVGMTGAFVTPRVESPIVVNVVSSLVSAVAQSLFGSLQWITIALLCYELRVRKEAIDLEQRIEQVEGPRIPPPPVQ